MSLRGLIFDVDGTLADTEEVHRQAFNAAFRKHGLSWHWGRRIYAELLNVTGGRERIAHFIGLAKMPVAMHRAMLALVPDIHRDKTAFYTQYVAQGHVALRSGVERLIVAARAAGMRIGIATTTSPANVEALIVGTLGEHAMAWFDAVAAGDAVSGKKPAPDVYHLALDRLRLPAQDCIAFEDSRNGVIAAKAASLYTIVTPTFWTYRDDLSAADLIVPSLIDCGDLDDLRSRHSRRQSDQAEAA